MIYLGICEDRGTTTDTLKVGRIKARIFGVHTENRSSEVDNKLISTENLPWCIPAFPINTQSIDGMSDFQVPQNGSIVLISFLDEVDKQHPVYFGTIPKIANQLPDWSKGFSDPNKQHPATEYLLESPVSRLARNEKIDSTIVKTKKDNVKTDVDCKESTFDEPETPYNATYTENRVIETKAGHFIEIDDTAGSERIHIYHKSGTFSEIHPDGKKVVRTEGKRTTIIVGDDNILIEGNNNIHITNSQNVHIEKSRNIQIDENEDTDITGTEKRDIGESQEVTIGTSQETTIGSTEERTIGESQEVTIGTSETKNVGTTQETTVGTSETKNIGGTQDITAGGNITLTAPMIYLN